MKKIYSFAMAGVVALTASANTKLVNALEVENVALAPRTATVALMPEEAVDYNNLTWKSLGKGVYAASVLADTYNGSTEPVEVEIFESNEQPGVYKAVGVWPDKFPSGNASLIVDASNPKCVKVPKQSTGLQDSVDGLTYIASKSWILADKGATDDQIIESLSSQNILPVLADGVIAFPPMSLLLNWPDAPEDSRYQTDPNAWYGGNSAGLLALPGSDIKLPWDVYGEATITGDFVMSVFDLNPTSYTVPVFQSTSDVTKFKLYDALNGTFAGLSFQGPSPSMEFDLAIPDNVVLPLSPTGISVQTDGALYLCTINQNYESIEDCPVESRSTSVNVDGNITISIPAKGLLLYAATSKKRYYANSGGAVTIVIKKKTTAVESFTVESDESAAVEYFNLQGMRVAEPKAGSLVIRRQGTQVTKVLVK